MRYLRRNHSTSQPHQLVFVDTETNAEVIDHGTNEKRLTFRLGCATAVRMEYGRPSRRQTLRFNDTEIFWAWLEQFVRPRNRCMAFAHNVGFDLTILNFWQLLADGKYKLWDITPDTKPDPLSPQKPRKAQGFFCIDDPPNIISCIRADNGGRLTWIDTLNYWVTSLAAIGESLAVPKLEMPIQTDDDETWFRYCENDVLIIETAVTSLLKWVEENDYGMFRATAPSQAMAAFRHRFMSHLIEFHENNKAKQLERAGYYGGRLECFFAGNPDKAGEYFIPQKPPPKRLAEPNKRQPYYEIDVTSLYPFAMAHAKYPTRLLYYQEHPLPVKVEQGEFDLQDLALVYLDTPCDQFPVRTNRGIYWAVGKFWTTLAGPELTKASNFDLIRRVKCRARYQCEYIFHDFIGHFWGRRAVYQQRGDIIQATLAKLLMNGLYGKFGQKTSEWENVTDHLSPVLCGHCIDIDVDTDTEYEWRSIGGYIQRRVERQEHPQAFPAIAAWVTSLAREYMSLCRDIAGWDNVYYMATDSLFVNSLGYKRLDNHGFIEPGVLGKFRVKQESKHAIFNTLHHYEIGDKEVHGSIKRKAQRLGQWTWSQDAFESLPAILKRPSDGAVKVRRITKTINPTYQRGTILPTGWIHPYVLDQSIQDVGSPVVIVGGME